MPNKDLANVSPAILRGLSDKIYEKRKTAALDIERLVRDWHKHNEKQQVVQLIHQLIRDYALSHANINSCRGGVVALAAVVTGIGKEASQYIKDIVPAILKCIEDNDSTTRFYACEALYNVAKVVREDIMIYLNEIFKSLSKLITDSNLRTGAQLLDRLIKDIVSERSTPVDIVNFIPLLRERIYSNNPYARQFIVSWISVLQSIAKFDLLPYLPEFLDGLFVILNDSSFELREMCAATLGEFLKEIKHRSSSGASVSPINYSDLIHILITHCHSTDEVTQLTAIMWIREFVNLDGSSMLPHCADLLVPILPVMAREGSGICQNILHSTEAAVHINNHLMDLVKLRYCREKADDVMDDKESKNAQYSDYYLDVNTMINVLMRMLSNPLIHTKLAALEWIYLLNINLEDQIAGRMDNLRSVLMETLKDKSDDVVFLDLKVLAKMSSPSKNVQDENEEDTNDQNMQLSISDPIGKHFKIKKDDYFMKVIVQLTYEFKSSEQFLKDRGAVIVRQLCSLLNAEDVYKAFARTLLNVDNMKFALLMVRMLNTILMTTHELNNLRQKLKELKDEDSCSLFSCLYYSWCHNPVATVSLCFLTQTYKHACDIIDSFGNFDITVDFLAEIDRLVQLLESPGFTYLRLQLLEIEDNYHLVKALYGLLMLLPQVSAFNALRQRLECVPALQSAVRYQSREGRKAKSITRESLPNVDFNDMLNHFSNVQQKHKAADEHK